MGKIYVQKRINAPNKPPFLNKGTVRKSEFNDEEELAKLLLEKYGEGEYSLAIRSGSKKQFHNIWKGSIVKAGDKLVAGVVEEDLQEIEIDTDEGALRNDRRIIRVSF